MSIPAPDIPVPSRVRELARGARLSPAWINDLDGLTFRATDADSTRFIKYEAHNAEWSAEAEAARLRWAAPFTPVPRVVCHGVVCHGDACAPNMLISDAGT